MVNILLVSFIYLFIFLIDEMNTQMWKTKEHEDGMTRLVFGGLGGGGVECNLGRRSRFGVCASYVAKQLNFVHAFYLSGNLTGGGSCAYVTGLCIFRISSLSL